MPEVRFTARTLGCSLLESFVNLSGMLSERRAALVLALRNGLHFCVRVRRILPHVSRHIRLDDSRTCTVRTGHS